MRNAAIIALLATLLASAARADPDCSGPQRWPASMALAQLKNAGLLSPTEIDFARSTGILLASQRIGPDRYRQVFRITFVRHRGTPVRAIALSDASKEECSMGSVTVYPVSAALPS